jgi:AAA+ superfamily predicted ATPase
VDVTFCFIHDPMSKTFELLIRAGNPLISIETIDEQRALDLVSRAADAIPRPLVEWSMTTGLRRLERGAAGVTMAAPGKALTALEHIRREEPERTIYVFKDLGPHCKDAQVHRALRDLLDLFSGSKCTLVMIDALPLPDEIRRFTVRYDLGWPTAEELEQVVRETYQRVRRDSYEQISSRLTRRDVEQLVQTLRGLTCSQAERVVASAILDDHALTSEDLPHVVESKRTLLGSQGCLEAIAADFSPDEIGGLENLKNWLKLRRGGFTREAREFGLEPPRGVLMLGVPGCGKSLCAKVVAADWGMPLLRLDPGVLYQKFIGESESQLRQALGQAEAMAPCILWIDEIEKAFASASASSADGGLSKRMFGTLLSWMQDHRHPIFIIATANDISALPPELMRKGRFDEVFFVDLPQLAARERILAIHLRRRNRAIGSLDINRIAAETEGFSGSELEQVVVAGLFSAFSQRQEPRSEHFLAEARRTRPLSVLNSERITRLRGWARNRCVPADEVSSGDSQTAASK